MKKNDLLLYLGFLLIVISLNILLYQSYLNKEGTCNADPIKFGVEQIKENYDAEYVYGHITILTDEKKKSWDFGDFIINKSLE